MSKSWSATHEIEVAIENAEKAIHTSIATRSRGTLWYRFHCEPSSVNSPPDLCSNNVARSVKKS